MRQITKLVTRSRIEETYQQTTVQCLQLLLRREEEAIVRDAVLDSLQALDIKQELPTPKPPLATPVVFKATAKVDQRVTN